MSPPVQSSSLPQRFSAKDGCVQTFGYERSTGKQSSPCVVSHFESALQKRGHDCADVQTLPALPKLQQSSPLLVSHSESAEQDFAHESWQMPLPGGGPLLLPAALSSSPEELLLQPPNPATAAKKTAPITTSFEEIEVRLIVAPRKAAPLAAQRAAARNPTD
jgi:hypothetical protein